MEATLSSVACPHCHSNQNVIPILYGRPAPQAIEQADKGLIKLSGCSPQP